MISQTTTVAANTPAGALRITGEDAFAYLQSQFSNDLRRPGVAHPVTYGLWLTRKGKVAADSLVLRLGTEDFLLLSDGISTEALEAKVPENIIADEVTVEPFVAERFTLIGAGTADTLRTLGLPVPEAGTWARHSGLLVVAVRRASTPAYDLVVEDAAAAAEVLVGIRNLMTSDAPEALERARILAGIPAVPVDCGSADLPQEAGFETFAVAFDKGCYLGQEVMARLHAQGRCTRTLTRVMAGDGSVLPPGTKLYHGDDEAGEIRSGISVDAGFMAFAMLKNRHADGVESFATEPGGTPRVARHSA